MRESSNNSRLNRGVVSALLGLPALTMIFGFIVLPSLLLCAVAFLTRSPQGTVELVPTMESFVRAIGLAGDGAGARNLNILLQTAAYAVPVSAVSVAWAFPIALWIGARRGRARYIALAAIMIPLCLNIVIRAYSWIILLGPTSLICRMLNEIGLLQAGDALYPSGVAVFIGMLSATLPFAILTLQSATDRIDWTLLDASEDLYAARIRAWYHGVIKGCMPAIRTAFLLTLIPSLGMFVVPDILGGAKSWMIGNLIQQQFGAARNWPYGASLSLLLMIVIVPCMIALLRTDHRATEGAGRPRSGAFNPLIAASGAIFLYLPLVTIVVAACCSESNGLTLGPPTIRWFTAAFGDREVMTALVNTLKVAAFSTALATVIGTMLAFSLERFSLPRFSRGLIDGALQLPLALPEVLLAVGIALTLGLLRQVSHLFDPGMFSMTLGHIAFQTAFVTLSVRAGLVSLGTGYEQAAADLYAGPRATFRRVTLPLISPSIIAGGILAFTLSLEDFAISFMTSSPDSTTLPVLLYGAIRRGISPKLHAISAILIVSNAILVIIVLRLFRRPTISA